MYFVREKLNFPFAFQKDDEQMSDSENDGFFVEHGYLSSDEGSGAEEDELLIRKCKLNEAEEKLASRRSQETDEERRQRLAQKAEEWKDQQRQKERRNKVFEHKFEHIGQFGWRLENRFFRLGVVDLVYGISIFKPVSTYFEKLNCCLNLNRFWFVNFCLSYNIGLKLKL